MVHVKVYEAPAGRGIMANLDHGADLLASIRRVAEENDVRAGVFWIIGAVRRAAIGYYDQGERRYVEASLDEPLEIASCMGNIAQYKGETLVHAHITLAGRDGRAFGGHLYEGTIIYAAELYLVELDLELEREYDETTGLNLFK
ncbi:MAG: PPC domain-containing DNA-binding protein [Candidatus Bathyarchaeia archaeon]